MAKIFNPQLVKERYSFGLDSPAKIVGFFEALKQGFDAWQHFGDRLETANRAVLYKLDR